MLQRDKYFYIFLPKVKNKHEKKYVNLCAQSVKIFIFQSESNMIRNWLF